MKHTALLGLLLLSGCLLMLIALVGMGAYMTRAIEAQTRLTCWELGQRDPLDLVPQVRKDHADAQTLAQWAVFDWEADCLKERGLL